MSRSSLLFITLGLFCSSAQAQITLHDVSGTVEQQRGTWQLARNGDSVTQALRTGTGRVTFQNGTTAQMTMGSSSLLQLNQNEPDLQNGRFYLQGDGRFYIQGKHYFTSGKVRIDLQDNVQRIAVIAGSLRIASGSQIIILHSNQQYNLKTMKMLAFSEGDPWYLARFIGTGTAQIEAVNGNVTLQDTAGSSHAVQPVEALQPGQVISTGDNAWAEVGFTGGGYLRLQSQSALSVMGIDKTSRGREVQLKLLRGSAWNVVAKGQGGYQITTPTITTAVRGTVFRIDSSGQAKVFDGKVAVMGSGDLTLPAGQQLTPGGQLQTLQPDASDLNNQALDALHQAPLKLHWNLKAAARELNITVQSQSSTQLTLKITPQNDTRRTVSSRLKATGEQFHLRRYLPEGVYLVEVQAQRFGAHKQLQGRLRIDRQPPQLGHLQVTRRGKLLHLSGHVTDASGVVLSATLGSQTTAGSQTYQRHLKAGDNALDWWLPLDNPQQTLRLTASDQAGNTATFSNPTPNGETGNASHSKP